MSVEAAMIVNIGMRVIGHALDRPLTCRMVGLNDTSRPGNDCYIANWYRWPIEIVDLPINLMVVFHSDWLVVTGTCFMTFHILGMSSSQLTNSYFSEGLKPPTRNGSKWLFGYLDHVKGPS